MPLSDSCLKVTWAASIAHQVNFCRSVGNRVSQFPICHIVCDKNNRVRLHLKSRAAIAVRDNRRAIMDLLQPGIGNQAEVAFGQPFQSRPC